MSATTQSQQGGVGLVASDRLAMPPAPKDLAVIASGLKAEVIADCMHSCGCSHAVAKAKAESMLDPSCAAPTTGVIAGAAHTAGQTLTAVSSGASALAARAKHAVADVATKISDAVHHAA